MHIYIYALTYICEYTNIYMFTIDIHAQTRNKGRKAQVNEQKERATNNGKVD